MSTLGQLGSNLEPRIKLAFERADRAEDALFLSAGGRNIAMTLAVHDDTLQTGVEFDADFSDALETAGKDDEIFKGYSRSQLVRWPSRLLVTTEGIDDELYFSATDETVSHQAFAAHVAQLCAREEVDIAPIDLIGMRGTPKSETGLPPYFGRLAIFTFLYANSEQGFLPFGKISQGTGLNSRVPHNHMPALIRSELVETESDGSRITYPTYQARNHGEAINEDELAETHWNTRTRTLAKRCLELARTNYGGAAMSVDASRETLAGSGEIEHLITSHQTHKQNEQIAKVMDWLNQQGYVDQAEREQERATHIKISDKGHEVIGKYLEILARHVVRDPALAASGERIAEEWLEDPERLSWLLTVDFDKGAIKRRQHLAERVVDIDEILLQNPNGLTTQQLMTATGMKRRALSNVLSDMRLSGRLESVKEGRSARHFAAKPE